MVVILTWPLAYIKEHLAAICLGEYAIMRRCPACEGSAGRDTVIGHGRRRRTCHSISTTGIVVRRGRCTRCGATITFLPCLVRPFHHYAVPVQAEALERHGGPDEVAWETAAPVVEDPDRYPSGSTVRRWFTPLGQRSLWRQVFDLCGGDGEPGAMPRGNARGALSWLLHMWRCLLRQARSGRQARVGAVPLSEGSAFLVLLLLWYPSRGWVVT